MKKGDTYPEIQKAINKMLDEAKTFDERKSAIDTAIKFAALQLKAKGNNFGKGFLEGDDDEDA